MHLSGLTVGCPRPQRVGRATPPQSPPPVKYDHAHLTCACAVGMTFVLYYLLVLLNILIVLESRLTRRRARGAQVITPQA